MKTKLWLALLSLYIVWGSTYLAIRFAVETMPPFFHASLRFLASGAILFIWRRAAGDPMPTKANWKSTAIVGTLLLVGGNGLVAFAEQSVPSGIAALIIATVPLWMALLSWLRGGVRPGGSTAVGLALGVIGILLLVNPGQSVGNGGAFIW